MKNVGYNNNVAIIGANSPAGLQIAMAIGKAYRLLLMDEDVHTTAALVKSIVQTTQSPEGVEILTCSKDASWEADAIVLAVPAQQQPIVAQKIAEVTTGKTIIQIIAPGNSAVSIQSLLPHSPIVRVTLQDTSTHTNAIVEGHNKWALQLALHLLSFTEWTIIEKATTIDLKK
ncbi:MAG: hypothetical protein KGK14_07365 [Bacteroidota bacterium]|jgi:hypothetical protein|nr:hypothetical protein [Bacteroidota bacterium]